MSNETCKVCGRPRGWPTASCPEGACPTEGSKPCLRLGYTRELAAREAADAALAAERVANAGLRDCLRAALVCHDNHCDDPACAPLSVAPPNAMGALRAASVEEEDSPFGDDARAAYEAQLETVTAAAIDEGREAVRLRRLLLSARKHGSPPGDYACVECRPHSEILIDGFRCWYHAPLTAPAAIPPAAAPQEGIREIPSWQEFVDSHRAAPQERIARPCACWPAEPHRPECFFYVAPAAAPQEGCCSLCGAQRIHNDNRYSTAGEWLACGNLECRDPMADYNREHLASANAVIAGAEAFLEKQSPAAAAPQEQPVLSFMGIPVKLTVTPNGWRDPAPLAAPQEQQGAAAQGTWATPFPGPWCEKHGDLCMGEPGHAGQCVDANGYVLNKHTGTAAPASAASEPKAPLAPAPIVRGEE